MIKLIKAGLTVLFCFIICGCAATESFWKVSNPFSRDSDIDDQLYASTKTAKVEQIREIAVKAVGLSAEEKHQTATTLANRLRSETDPVLKLELVKATGSFASIESLEALRHALRDPDVNIRIATCRALAKMNSPQSLEMLAQVVHADSNLDVRAAAVRGLGNFDGPDAVRALSVALDSTDPAIQYLAVQSLRKSNSQDLGNSVAAWQQFARRTMESRKTASRTGQDPQ